MSESAPRRGMSLTSAGDGDSPRDLASRRGRKGRLFGLASSMRLLFGISKETKLGKVFHHNKPDGHQPAEEGRALSQSSFFSTNTSYIGGPGGSSWSGSRPNSGSSSPANGAGDNSRRAVSPLAATPTKPAITRVSSETDTDTPTSHHSGAYDTIDEVDEEEYSILGTPRPHTPRMGQKMRLPAYDELIGVSPDYGQSSLSPASQIALRKKIADAARVLPAPSFCSANSTSARAREPHILGRIPRRREETSSPGRRSNGASTFGGATNSSKEKPRHVLDRGPRGNSSNYYNYSDHDVSSPVRSSSPSRIGPDSNRGHNRSGSGRSSGRSAMAAHGRHPSAADTAILRAANEGHISPTAMDEVSGRAKVIINEMEKCFIQSLREVDTGERSTLPALLAPACTPQHIVPLASPCAPENQDEYVGSCVGPVGPKKTLVLDLDETLISSTRTPCPCDFLIVFKIHDREPPPATHVVDNGAEGDDEDPDQYDEDVEEEPETTLIKRISYYVRLRPGLAKFLRNAASMYELVVWTASGKSYADAIIDLLDPDNKLFSQRLYRESCVRHRGLCVKDLRRLGRPMSSVLLVDNYIYSFGFTLDNGMPISPWTGEEGADESGLMIAIALLQKIARAQDVRTPLIKTFDLHRAVHGTRSSTLTPAHLHRLNSCVSDYRSNRGVGSLSPSSSTSSGHSSGSGGSSLYSWGGKSFTGKRATPRRIKGVQLGGSWARKSQLASASDAAATVEARGTGLLE